MHTTRKLLLSLLPLAAQFASVPGALGQGPLEERVIDVLVVPTERAIDWAVTERFRCEDVVPGNGEDPLPPAAVDPTDQTVTRAVIQGHIRTLRSLGMSHVCETGDVGNFSAGPETEEERYSAIYNLVSVGIAELNDIYAASGIDDVEFRLVGWDPETLRYPGLGSYEAFRDGRITHKDGGKAFLAGTYRVLSGGTVGEIGGLSKLPLGDEPLHAYRKRLGADIAVVVTQPTEGFTGAASGLGIHSPDRAFAWVSVEHATAPHYTLAHEVSHLLGADHFGAENLGLLGKFDTLSLEPDYTDDGFGRKRLDNYGYVGRARIPRGADREGFRDIYYGTLMSKSNVCKEYVTAPESRILAEERPCREDGQGSFFKDFIVIPRLSSRLEMRDAPMEIGIRGYRDNARVVANSIDRFTTFSERLGEAVPTEEKIGIDFGYDRYGWLRIPYETSEPGWNHITETRWGTRVEDLAYEGDSGVRSGISLELRGVVERRATAHFFTEMELAQGVAPIPTMAMVDGFLIRRGATLRFTGLDPVRTYGFRVFSSATVHDRPRPAKVTVVTGDVPPLADERDPTVKIQGTHFNRGRAFEFAKVSPDAEGVVELTVEPHDRENEAFMAKKRFSVNLNAVELFDDTDRSPYAR